jgi:hypothetical protein
MLLGRGGIVDARAIILARGASCFAALASVAQRRAAAPAPTDLSLSVRLITYLVKQQRDSMTFTVDTRHHVLPDFLVRPSPPYGRAASGAGMPRHRRRPLWSCRGFLDRRRRQNGQLDDRREMSHDTASNGTGRMYEANIQHKTSGQQQLGACGHRSASIGDADVKEK